LNTVSQLLIRQVWLPYLLSVVVLVVPVFHLAELLPLFVEVRAPESAC
jgi:hypothetical protein